MFTNDFLMNTLLGRENMQNGASLIALGNSSIDNELSILQETIQKN